MASPSNDVFDRHEKVVAAVDLPGVPAGTAGKVLLVAGMTWIRYRVRFDNGAEIGTLDRSTLVSRAEWADRARNGLATERAAALDGAAPTS